MQDEEIEDYEEIVDYEVIVDYDSTDSEEEQEMLLSQQESRIAETNSVTGDQSRISSLNRNDMRIAPFGSSTSRNADESPDHPAMEISGRDASSPISEVSDEEMSTSDRDSPLHSDMMNHLFCRVEAAARELLLSLIPSRSRDLPPPDRLPVSISPESFPPSVRLRIQRKKLKKLKIDLKKQTSNFVQSPSKYITSENNGNLPSMDVSEESIRSGFDLACDHLAYFAEKLMDLMTALSTRRVGRTGDVERTKQKTWDYGLAFELFKEEFLKFDEMVTIALKRLRALVSPDVAKALNERHRDVKKKFWKLELASFMYLIRCVVGLSESAEIDLVDLINLRAKVSYRPVEIMSCREII